MKPPSTVERPADRHVTQLVKRSALAAGVRGDLTEGERRARFSGHFAARRPRLLGRGRRALCPEAARPFSSRNDPALPAPPRPVPGQSHQGGGIVNPGIPIMPRLGSPSATRIAASLGASIMRLVEAAHALPDHAPELRTRHPPWRLSLKSRASVVTGAFATSSSRAGHYPLPRIVRKRSGCACVHTLP
jgi:hypothetical protein